MPSVFEEKSSSKAIMRVGLPAMLGQLTTLIYNLADTFFVSLTREPAMIAAVTLCAPILLIIMSIACVFGMGGSSVIARLLGEDKKEESGTTMNFCVYAMAIAGIAVLALGLAFLQPLAKISGADADNIAYTCDYLKWIFLGAPFIMMANGFVHLFRSVGLIKEGTIGLVLGNAINMVLDYVFIAIFRWGTGGAALATSLGFACATVYYMFCMICEGRKGNQLVPLTPKRFSLDGAMIRNVVSIGIPGALITVLMSVSNMGDCLFQKTFNIDPITHKAIPNKGQLPQYYLEDCIPAIVSKEVWTLAQLEIQRRQTWKPMSSAELPFKNRIVCGTCGSGVVQYYAKRKGSALETMWRCGSWRNGKAKGESLPRCAEVKIPLDAPEKAFVRAWNLVVSKKLQYSAALRRRTKNAEDALSCYRAKEMLRLLDEVGKLVAFDYHFSLKVLDHIELMSDGKLAVVFLSGVRLTI